MADRVVLTIGTKKGVFVADATKPRRRFALRGNQCATGDQDEQDQGVMDAAHHSGILVQRHEMR